MRPKEPDNVAREFIVCQGINRRGTWIYWFEQESIPADADLHAPTTRARFRTTTKDCERWFFVSYQYATGIAWRLERYVPERISLNASQVAAGALSIMNYAGGISPGIIFEGVIRDGAQAGQGTEDAAQVERAAAGDPPR